MKKSEIKVRLWVIIGTTALSKRLIETPITITVFQPLFQTAKLPVFKSYPVTDLKVYATFDALG